MCTPCEVPGAPVIDVALPAVYALTSRAHIPNSSVPLTGIITDTDGTDPPAVDDTVVASIKQYRYTTVASGPADAMCTRPVATADTHDAHNATRDDVALTTTTEVAYPRNTRLLKFSSGLVECKHNDDNFGDSTTTGREPPGATDYTVSDRHLHAVDATGTVTPVVALAIVAATRVTGAYAANTDRPNGTTSGFSRAVSS